MRPEWTGEYPTSSSPQVTAAMKGNRRVDTGPETRLRSALHRRGLRFRKDYPVQLPGRKVRPDIVFTARRVAVFVDGCFWHGCPEHGRIPSGSNAAYWHQKIEGNRSRDARQTKALEAEGWLVIRIWEHVPLEEAAEIVAQAMAVRLGT